MGRSPTATATVDPSAVRESSLRVRRTGVGPKCTQVRYKDYRTETPCAEGSSAIIMHDK